MKGSRGAGERGLCHSERSEESRGGERGSRERVLAAWNGRPHDHVPLTTWCFGLQAPPHLRWERDGQERTYWYSLRMEHIHTLPHPSAIAGERGLCHSERSEESPWDLEDDFRRVLAWQSLGVDDVLDVSVPWSVDPQVTWQDSRIPPPPPSPPRKRGGWVHAYKSDVAADFLPPASGGGWVHAYKSDVAADFLPPASGGGGSTPTSRTSPPTSSPPQAGGGGSTPTSRTSPPTSSLPQAGGVGPRLQVGRRRQLPPPRLRGGWGG